MQRVLTPDKTVSGLSNPLIELLRTRLPGMVIGWRVSKSDFRPLRNRDAFGSASRQTLLISARPAQNIDQIITQDNFQTHSFANYLTELFAPFLAYRCHLLVRPINGLQVPLRSIFYYSLQSIDFENSPHLRSKERFVSFLINLFGVFIEAWEVGYRRTTRTGSLDLTSQLFSGRPAC